MSRRTDRISKLLQQQISSLVFKMKKNTAAMVTITGVTVSPDIKNARVFYSVLDENEAENCRRALEESVGFFSKHLSKTLHTKNFPKISFEYDATPKRAARLFEIFDKLEKENDYEK